MSTSKESSINISAFINSRKLIETKQKYTQSKSWIANEF